MPLVNAIAKKDCLPYFKKGERIQIIPILYEEDTLIRNEIYGVFHKDKLICFFDPALINKYPKDVEFRKVEDKLYAPKGSYKDSVIKVENGSVYPSNIVGNYFDYFDKINLG